MSPFRAQRRKLNDVLSGLKSINERTDILFEDSLVLIRLDIQTGVSNTVILTD